MSTKRPADNIKSPDQLTEQDHEILRLKNKEGLTFRQIGEALGMTRQGAQIAYRRAGGSTDRQWPVNKPDDAVHTAEVRVAEKVLNAAAARLEVVCDQLQLVGSSRPTLAAVCRELIREPLDDETFPQLDQPFSSNPPGALGATAQIVRWRDVWGTYRAAQAAIHERGYSVSQVIDGRLEKFARTGALPGVLRHYQIGDDE